MYFEVEYRRLAVAISVGPLLPTLVAVILKRQNLLQGNFSSKYPRNFANAAGKSLPAHATLKSTWGPRHMSLPQQLSLTMVRKCSVSRGSIDENNDSISHGIVAKLTSAAEFSDAEDLAKQFIIRVRDIQDYRLF